MTNLIGSKFGKLLVVDKSDKRTTDGCIVWVCLCDCGNRVNVNTNKLNTGHTRSCGCLAEERSHRKRFNIYIKHEGFIEGFTLDKTRFVFDYEDFDKVKEYTWVIGEQGYVVTQADGKYIRQHRMIMDSPEMCIDHINGNKTDNRKCNLRLATKQQNGINRPANRNNPLGVKGVSRTRNGKYIARIMVDGKTRHLGIFNSIELAAEARQKAEQNIFGEFAYHIREEV